MYIIYQQGEHTDEKQIHNRGDYNDGCICSNLMRIRIFKYPNSTPKCSTHYVTELYDHAHCTGI